MQQYEINNLDKLDKYDPINSLFIAQYTGDISDKVYDLRDKYLSRYLDYLYELTKEYKDTILSATENSSPDSMGGDPRTYNILSDSVFFNNFKVNLKRFIIAGKVNMLNERLLVDLINKIKARKFSELTKKQSGVLFETSNNYFSDFVQRMKYLPQLMPKEIEKKLKAYYQNQGRFREYFKIKRIYKVNTPHKEGFKYKRRVVHGTSNVSLISILADGFTRPSDNANSPFVRHAGQSLGDGIYFARNDQIGKTMAYIDDKYPPYIIVADVYYDRITHVNTFKPCKLNGKNIVHAHAVGNYGFDEIVAAPEQIRIVQIIELERKH